MPSEVFQVGAVLFPNFELLDVFGPLEMLGLLGHTRVQITMLALERGEVASNQGPKAWADLSLEESTAFDLLLVPGGWGTRREVAHPKFLEALAATVLRSRLVASVCTGSALLAKLGLLDGKRATTNKLAFDWVATQGPKVHWVRKARWIQDGTFFTSSGVSAGMDMTLDLIRLEFGAEAAEQVARYAEYTWNRDSENDPFCG